MMSNSKFFEIEGVDHPLLLYLLCVLGGISVLDMISTNCALSSHVGIEGNPLMSPILCYAPLFKFGYILLAYLVSYNLEHRHKYYGVIVLSIICVIGFAIVTNNILILYGINLFY